MAVSMTVRMTVRVAMCIATRTSGVMVMVVFVVCLLRHKTKDTIAAPRSAQHIPYTPLVTFFIARCSLGFAFSEISFMLFRRLTVLALGAAAIVTSMAVQAQKPGAKAEAGVMPPPKVAATLPAAAPQAEPAAAGASETGLAAVYSDKLNGRKTASGVRYDRNKLTAAHKTLPFGTLVRVTNNKNKKSVTLRITDRGPAQPDRILDISPRAAKALGISRLGMGEVTAVVVKTGSGKKKK